MRKPGIMLSAVVVLFMSTHAFARDSTQTPKTSSPTAQSERPKTEVDHQIEEAKKHGDMVLMRCLENCDDKEKIEGDVEGGHALELPKPAYPAIASRAHAAGQVLVQILVDEEGKVVAAAAVSGHPLLYGVSVAAARQARFSPTKFKGDPVKVTGVITYNFIAQ